MANAHPGHTEETALQADATPQVGVSPTEPTETTPQGSAAGPQTIQLKALVLGDSGVGKTFICRAWARKSKPIQHQPTPATQTYEVRAKGLDNVSLVVYDVRADEDKETAKELVSRADAFALIYDARDSYPGLRYLDLTWVPLLKEVAKPVAEFVLVANRSWGKTPAVSPWVFSHAETVVYHALPQNFRKAMELMDGVDRFEQSADHALWYMFDRAYRRRCDSCRFSLGVRPNFPKTFEVDPVRDPNDPDDPNDDDDDDTRSNASTTACSHLLSCLSSRHKN